MEKVLTVVIPTYNMQAYLNRCLDSLVVEEDALMEALEVLVVNDGSKDGSSAIAHDYQQRFPATFRVIDKENGNYGSCINRGLSEARGKFIKILDADDWFDGGPFALYLQKLLELEEPVDLVLTDYTKVDEEGKVLAACRFPLEYDRVFSFQEYPGLDYFAHHALTYRKDFLLEHAYRQTEGISYTDNEWMYYPQLYVDRCVYWNLDVYRYFIGREGQTMAPQTYFKRIPQLITILKRMVLELAAFRAQGEQGMGATRLAHFILHTSKGIYNSYLVKSSADAFPAGVLKDFDAFLYEHDREVYDAIGSGLVLKGVPIHYVRFWRRFGKRFPVDAPRALYRRIRYGKQGK